MAQRLKKIISGGQTGGDFGGLLAGKELGLLTGGTAPKGYLTDAGPNLKLKDYGLEEGEYDPKTYPKRTMKNVDAADLTIAFRFGGSAGTDKTIGYANTGVWGPGETKPGLHMGTRGKPVLVITEQNVDNAAKLIREAIQKVDPEVVNIAGHREKSFPGIERFVKESLVKGLSNTATPGPIKVASGTGKHHANVPMSYKMAPDQLRKDLRERFPEGTSTLELIKAGLRTATTRAASMSPWKVGDTISFEGDPTIYRVTSRGLPEFNKDPEAWAKKEGWDPEAIRRDPKLLQQATKVGAVQTTFERVDKADEPVKVKGLGGAHQNKIVRPDSVSTVLDASSIVKNRSDTYRQEGTTPRRYETYTPPDPSKALSKQDAVMFGKLGKPETTATLERMTKTARELGPDAVRPTPRELSAVWKELIAHDDAKFSRVKGEGSGEYIDKVVRQLIKDGTIRLEAREMTVTLALHSVDHILGRERGESPAKLAKAVDMVRYVGGERGTETAEEAEALAGDRASEDLKTKFLGAEPPLSPEDRDLRAKSLKGPSGRKFITRVIDLEDPTPLSDKKDEDRARRLLKEETVAQTAEPEKAPRKVARGQAPQSGRFAGREMRSRGLRYENYSEPRPTKGGFRIPRRLEPRLTKDVVVPGIYSKPDAYSSRVRKKGSLVRDTAPGRVRKKLVEGKRVLSLPTDVGKKAKTKSGAPIEMKRFKEVDAQGRESEGKLIVPKAEKAMDQMATDAPYENTEYKRLRDIALNNRASDLERAEAVLRLKQLMNKGYGEVMQAISDDPDSVQKQMTTKSGKPKVDSKGNPILWPRRTAKEKARSSARSQSRRLGGTGASERIKIKEDSRKANKPVEGMQLDAEGGEMYEREEDVGKPRFKNFRSPDELYTAPTGKGRQGILRSSEAQASRKNDADKYRFRLTESLKARKGRELLKEEIERIEAKVAKKYAGPGAIPSHTLEDPESFKFPQEEVQGTSEEPKPEEPKRIKVKSGRAKRIKVSAPLPAVDVERLKRQELEASNERGEHLRVIRRSDFRNKSGRLSDARVSPPARIKVDGRARNLIKVRGRS